MATESNVPPNPAELSMRDGDWSLRQGRYGLVMLLMRSESNALPSRQKSTLQEDRIC